MYNDFVVSNNLLGNTTLHNRSEGVREDVQGEGVKLRDFPEKD